MAFTSVTDEKRKKDDSCIERAQRRLLRDHRRLGTWRAVEAKIGANHGYIVALVKNGIVPSNPAVRKKLGLPRVLPSERKPRVNRIIPSLGSEGWEQVFFRKLKPKKWKGQKPL